MSVHHLPTASVPLADHARAPARFTDERSNMADTVVRLTLLRGERGHADMQDDRGGPRHPRREPRGRVHDLFIRMLGLGLIAVAGGAVNWLDGLVHALPQHSGTIGEYLLATVGFLGASVGFGLLVLGRHIGDRIEVSDRWRPRT